MFTRRPSLRDLMIETRVLDGRLQGLSDQTARPLGLSATRAEVLEKLIEQPLTVAQLGRRLGLARQSVQRTVDLMTREDLVRGVANPDHQRAKLIELTDRAHRLLQQLREEQQTLTQRLTTGLSDDDLGGATGVLRTLRQRIENLTDVR